MQKRVKGFEIGKEYNRNYYEHFCINCGIKRWVRQDHFKSFRFVGRCKKCSSLCRIGKESPGWKRGKTISSEGYIMIFLPTHPLAKKRGYILEHRLVACKEWGVEAIKDMVVHHKDGNKQNNNIDNLEVLTPSRHTSNHKRPLGYDSRLQGEPNPEIDCACGCGESFKKYDKQNRLRKYIYHHSRENQYTISNSPEDY